MERFCIACRPRRLENIADDELDELDEVDELDELDEPDEHDEPNDVDELDEVDKGEPRFPSSFFGGPKQCPRCCLHCIDVEACHQYNVSIMGRMFWPRKYSFSQ